MSDSLRDQRLDDAIAAYYRAIETGRPPEREAFLAEYPDLRADLESFLNDKAAFELRAGAAPIGETITLSPNPPVADAPESIRRTIRYFGDYELLEEIA